MSGNILVGDAIRGRVTIASKTKIKLTIEKFKSYFLCKSICIFTFINLVPVTLNIQKNHIFIIPLASTLSANAGLVALI